MEAFVDVPPVAADAIARLRAELEVSEPTAQVLARRGLADPAAARRFMAADERHPLAAFDGLAAAAERVLDHVARGSRIVVHGDYDCDGVCATAILVRGLRSLGATCTWYLPHRREDGYGLAADTVTRLAAEGADLIVTVDCGITAAAEVAIAREHGVDVVVTDHHRPPSAGPAPDCAVVHPALGGYPCPELCGAGVAHRLVAALLEAAGRDPAEADVDLDLVAVATVADCVPLVGENRRLVREGLVAVADTRRPGLRALLEVARTAPAEVDATAVAFRLAPRLNAVGRLGRADPAVRLLLCDDEEEARRLAARLDRANEERRAVEQRILREAEAALAAAGERDGYVLAGEGWHPGVVGIVASRIVERTGRPAVLVALDGEAGTGSGRSIPGFDLLAGLDACAPHLLRHGGHRAAAGCTVAAASVAAFADAFAAHAAEALAAAPAQAALAVDAVLGGTELDEAQVAELARLAPFGVGNPEPRLLVPVARATGVHPMGEGRHLRLALRCGPSSCAAVAFGRSALPVADGEPMAVVGALELHRWGGVARPRLRVEDVRPAGAHGSALRRPAHDVTADAIAVVSGTAPWGPGPWAPWAEDERPSAVARGGPGVRPGSPSAPVDAAAGADRPVPGLADAEDLSAGGPAAAVVRLVHRGGPVVVVVADAARAHARMAPVVGGATLVDWWDLVRDPGLLDDAAWVLALDPPTAAAHVAALEARPGGRLARCLPGAGLPLASDVLADELDLRPALADLYRRLRDAGPTAPAALAAALPAPGWRVGLLLRLLVEVGVVHVERDGTARAVPGARGALEASPTHVGWRRQGRERRAWLTGSTDPAPVAAAG